MDHRETETYNQQSKYHPVHIVADRIYCHMVCYILGRNIYPCIRMYRFHLTCHMSADQRSRSPDSYCYTTYHIVTQNIYFHIRTHNIRQFRYKLECLRNCFVSNVCYRFQNNPLNTSCCHNRTCKFHQQGHRQVHQRCRFENQMFHWQHSLHCIVCHILHQNSHWHN